MEPPSPTDRYILVVGSWVAMALLCHTGLGAQELGTWGQLRPGPHRIGYNVRYEIDHSRIWVVVPDSAYRKEVSRPIRISVWYPSDPGTDDPTMQLEEFVRDSAPDEYFGQLNALLEQRFVKLFSNTSVDLYRALLALPLATIKDAPPATGSFPLVLYSPGGQASFPDNGVLASYLASHGYIVASVPQLETRLQPGTQRGSNQLETQTRDIEFAMGVLQDFPGVDRRKLAVIGYSFGGLVALRMASRNTNVDAIVGLDPSFAYVGTLDQIDGTGSLEIAAFRTPILSLQAGNADSRDAFSPAIHDTLHYSDRYFGYVGSTVHADFSEIKPMLVPAVAEGQSLEPELLEARRGYTAMCAYVLNFLNGVLRGDTVGLSFVSRSSQANGMDPDLVEMGVEYKADVPTEEEFVQMLISKGYDETKRRLHSALDSYPHLVVVREGMMNALGYQQRDARELDLAIDIFRLNTTANPKSARALNGLAEAYLTNGDSLGVISTYERLLDILPDDPTIGRREREQLRRNTEIRLRILRPSTLRREP